MPRRNAELTITGTHIWQAHTAFKSDSILVGRDTAEDNLYVLATLRVGNRLSIPIFLKDFTATLTTADGQTLETSAIETRDLPNLYQVFPALKPLSTTVLPREITITPSQFAEGTVILRFPATEDTWKRRQKATLTVAFYHQPPQTITISQP
jgi:hypothetical protein